MRALAIGVLVLSTTAFADSPKRNSAIEAFPLEATPSLTDWCAAQKNCSLEKPLVGARLEKPERPWLEARIVTAEKDDLPECFLAVRTARGWFVGDLVYCQDGDFRHDESASLETAAFQGTALVVSLSGTDTYRRPEHDQPFTTVWVCGVGPSGTPSCTPALDLQPPLKAKAPPEAALTYSFTADSIVLRPTNDQKAPMDPDLRARAGRHRVKFP